MGFVGRRQAEEMLKNSKSGTFLLRFSDSELGGVTIAWMYEDVTKRMLFALFTFLTFNAYMQYLYVVLKHNFVNISCKD